MSGDSELREAVRRSDAQPQDPELAVRAASLHLRRGPSAAARDLVVRALSGRADPETFGLARQAEVKFVVLEGQLVAATSTGARPLASLPVKRGLAERGVVAGVLEDEPGKVAVLSLGGGLSPWPDSPFEVPDFHASCVALAGSTLFVAGDSSVVASLDLRHPEKGFRHFDLPPECAQNHVDALFVDGSRLVVVDDLAWPKYVVAYDVAKPQTPRLLTCRELDSVGTWANVAGASLGPRALAVLVEHRHAGFLDPSEGERPGPTYEVRLANPLSLEARASVEVPAAEGKVDLAVAGRRLLVTLGENGVAAHDLVLGREVFTPVDLELAPGERAASIAPVPGTNDAIVALTRGDALRFELLREPVDPNVLEVDF